MKFWSCLAPALLLGVAMAQEAPRPPDTEPLASGLWWLYHLQYDRAHQEFDRHIAQNPDDPAGYFYKSATDWWHLAQEFEMDRADLQERFFRTADLTIAKAEKRLDALDLKTDKKEAARLLLYKGGAEGLSGRWLVTQKRWVKAYFAGRAGHRDLQQAVELDPTLYDAYLGLGIYDYFTDTLSGFMGAISSVFVRGDRQRGIRQLEIAIEKASHARTEAAVFLAEIFTFEEDTPERAIPICERLSADYPHSPLMSLMHVTALFQAKRWPEALRTAQDFLAKSEQATPWYTQQGVDPALYTIGASELWGNHAPEKALPYFEKILAGDPNSPSRWISFAHLRRGDILKQQGQIAMARQEYQTVLRRADIWGTHSDARKALRSLKQSDPAPAS